MDRKYRPIVAVIEDHADTRSMLGLMLQDHFEVSLFESGEAAIAGLEGRHPDLLIVDIGMPHMNGEALLSHLRVAMPTIRAVAFTGRAYQRDLERALAAGFDAVVRKPQTEILVETLLNMVEPQAKKAS